MLAVYKVLPEHKDSQAAQVPQVSQEPLVHKDLQGPLALQVFKVTLEPQVYKATRVQQEQRALKEPLDHKD